MSKLKNMNSKKIHKLANKNNIEWSGEFDGGEFYSLDPLFDKWIRIGGLEKDSISLVKKKTLNKLIKKINLKNLKKTIKKDIKAQKEGTTTKIIGNETYYYVNYTSSILDVYYEDFSFIFEELGINYECLYVNAIDYILDRLTKKNKI